MTAKEDSLQDKQPAPSTLSAAEGRRGSRDEAAMWTVFADICQSLQVSSASIKAATSSLLDTSIIWDRSSQHEFMQIIDRSINRISALIVVMTLAMKAESGPLELAPEPCSVQEILSRVADALGKDEPHVAIELSLPDTGKPALVDYDYLRMALKILLEALIGAGRTPPPALRIRAEDTPTQWQIEIDGEFTGAAAALVAWLGAAAGQPLPLDQAVSAEAILKALTAVRLLQQQNITVSFADEAPGRLALVIPFTGEGWTSAARS